MIPTSSRRRLRLVLAGSILLAILALLSPIGKKFRASISSTPSNQAPPSQKSAERASLDRHLANSRFETGTWTVPADFTEHLGKLRMQKYGPAPDDPFEDGAFDTVYLALKALEVPFPRGSRVRFDLYTGSLEIKNLPENLDQIDSLIAALQPMPMWVLDRALFSTGEAPITDVSADVDWMSNKLRTIIIPEVHFEDTTVGGVIDFLKEESKKHDPDELIPDLEGIPIHIEGPYPPSATIRELHLRNVPVAVVLQHTCDSSALRYKVGPDGVTLLYLDYSVPREVPTIHWHLDPAVIERLRLPDGEPWSAQQGDPFANADDPPVTREEWIAKRKSQSLTDLLEDLLKGEGLSFPGGSSLTYEPEQSAISIRSHRWNLDLFEALFEHAALQLSKERALGLSAP